MVDFFIDLQVHKQLASYIFVHVFLEYDKVFTLYKLQAPSCLHKFATL